MKRVLMAFLVIVLVAGAAGGVYYWQQSRVKNLNQQVSDLQTQASNLQSQLQKANDTISQQPNFDYKSVKGVSIKVFLPLAKAKVGTPLIVMGEVPGNWSFEAQFPVQLKDSSGKVIAQGPASLLGNWMTDAPVPFAVTLNFTAPTAGSTGTLVLMKDNPSGLPQNDDSLSIPVQF